MNKKSLLIEIIVGFILSYWIITTWFSGNTIFENLALGTETESYQARDERGDLIHIVKITKEEREEFVSGWETRGMKKVILFFGNSQMHSINQKKPGEVNCLELMYLSNKNDSVEVLGNSLPNAGLQEFYLAYQYWKKILPIKAVVIPLFMDDMREGGVRNVFFSELIAENYQLNDSTDDLIRQINKNLRDYWSTNANNKTTDVNDIAALKETFQEKTERYFNGKLEQNSQAWNNRSNVRGDFFIWGYKLRNTVFGINANTVRKMIPSRYESNRHALELIVRDCMKENQKMLLYIPPIRNDVKLPYDAIEYSRFKTEMENLASLDTNGITFRNYEGIVPAQLWGYQAATNLKSDREADFMHFQFRGHQILADSLQHFLIDVNK